MSIIETRIKPNMQGNKGGDDAIFWRDGKRVVENSKEMTLQLI